MSQEYNAKELNVLQRILSEGSIRRAEALGVRTWHFTNEVMLKTFLAIQKHSNKDATRNQTPSQAYMRKLVPEFPDYCAPEETLQELVGELITDAFKRDLEETVEDCRLLVKRGQYDLTLEYMIQKVRELSRASNSTSRMDLPEGLTHSLKEYEETKAGGGLRGLPFPYSPLNRALQGHRPGNLNVLYAPPKHGKTWALLWLSCVFPFLTSNARVLFITTESPEEEIMDRIACLLARVPYKGFIEGTLSYEEERRFNKTVEDYNREDYNNIVGANEDTSGTSHRGIRVIFGSDETNFVVDAIKEYEPDIVCIDGIYNLIANKNHEWKEIKVVIAEMKSLAMSEGVCVVATAQTNRSGWIKIKDLDPEEAGDVGMSSGFNIYCDGLIRVHLVKARAPTGEYHFRQFLNLPLLRKNFIPPFVINFNPGVDHTLFAEEATTDQVARWAEEIEGEDDSEEDQESEDSRPSFKRGGKSSDWL